MFESLTQRLQDAIGALTRKGTLTEADVESALRAVRTALLTADVHVSVVKKLVADIRERAVGEKVLESVRPDQQVVKIVHDELVRLMGGEVGVQSAPGAEIVLNWAARGPTVVLMAGLQGAGKTTTCAKLGRLLKSRGRNPLLVAADMQRPAAVEQLRVLGESLGLAVHCEERGRPPKICARAVKRAAAEGHDVVILDTAGRLHVDRELMAEVEDIADKVSPNEVFLVLDSMTGQDAVNSAKAFDDALPLTGVVLTKLDGDTRGGAALSVRAVTGKPIRFIGTGEKPENLEPFHPDRLASRVLGMGDVVSLVERAQSVMHEKEAEAAAERMFAGSFTMEDMLAQFEQVERMGPMKEWLSMLPGVGAALADQDLDEKPLRRSKAIIQSMTLAERRDPDRIDHARKRRIARGSGTSIDEVGRLLKGHRQMRKMMKGLGSQGGLMNKMMSRRLRKQKERQMREMRRRGVKFGDLGLGGGSGGGTR